MNISLLNNTPINSLVTDKLQSNMISEPNDFKEQLEVALNGDNNEELKEACDTMEKYMLSQIFKQMKASTKLGEGIIEKGDYEETFEDYLVQAQTEEMVKAGGVGLSKMMYESLTRR